MTLRIDRFEFALIAVADQRLDLGESLLDRLQLPDESRLAVDVERRPELIGQPGDREVFAVKVAVAVVEVVHDRLDGFVGQASACRDSDCSKEFVDGQIGGADQASQCSLPHFFVIRYAERGRLTIFDQDDVTSVLTRGFPPDRFEHLDDFSSAHRGNFAIR